MRTAQVFYNGELAGELAEEADGYTFRYHDDYLQNPQKPAISLSFPKTQKEAKSRFLFPFFYGLLAEGETKTIQCDTLKIDENDHFTRLISTGSTATIGAITLREAR